MSLSLLLPPAMVMVAVVLLASINRWLRPREAAWALTGATMAAAGASLGLLATIALEFIHGVPWFEHRLLWCLHLTPPGGGTTWTLGVLTVSWTSAIAVRVRRTRVAHRALCEAGAAGPEIEIVPQGSPTAFSLPGRPGRIVVSASMLAALPTSEREVLFAHERSHLVHRHDRFIYLADLATSVFPPLAAMAGRIRDATERWADEDAAMVVGDRRLVARALARAAIAQQGAVPPIGPAMAHRGVRGRIDAVTSGPRSQGAAAAAALVGSIAALLAASSSTVELHHLAVLAEHVCRPA